MAIPSSGTVSLTTIQTEYGGSSPISLSEYYRGGVYVPSSSTTTTIPTSGAISVSNFYGTSNTQEFTISTNQTNLNLRTYVNGLGYNGLANVVVTINAGVYVYATTTSSAALTTGTFPQSLTIINNGYIVGKGGVGGTNFTGAGGAGGTALTVQNNISITNNNTIAGGGGGGGGGSFYYFNGPGYFPYVGGGGGAGGGVGGAGGNYGGVAGGSGGSLGGSGSDGAGFNPGGNLVYGRGGGAGGGAGVGQDNGRAAGPGSGSGGGGGYVFPGAGGAGGTASYSRYGGAGGSGGSAGSAGYNSGGSGGGGGWGASGGIGWGTYEGVSPQNQQSAGGAGGNCTSSSGYTVTWLTAGTRYGTLG